MHDPYYEALASAQSLERGIGRATPLYCDAQIVLSYLRRLEPRGAPEVLAWSRPQLSERMAQAVATAEVAALFGEEL